MRAADGWTSGLAGEGEASQRWGPGSDQRAPANNIIRVSHSLLFAPVLFPRRPSSSLSVSVCLSLCLSPFSRAMSPLRLYILLIFPRRRNQPSGGMTRGLLLTAWRIIVDPRYSNSRLGHTIHAHPSAPHHFHPSPDR